MATTSEKYRINALAKDFNLKSKDLITVLENAGFTGKTHMAVLEENELSIIFETLTQNNQVDITAFFKEYDDKKKSNGMYHACNRCAAAVFDVCSSSCDRACSGDAA
jgi:translation initiation factor IF-2